MLIKKVLIILSLIIILSLQLFVRGGSISPILYQLTFNKNIELKSIKEERINVVLLGIAGGKHEGPNLSDTIIFASLNLTDPKITLVSIPRDLWLGDLNAKVNTAYAKGEARKENGGLILAKSVVGKITGQPIDYAVVVDFSGFVKAVDLMGGLDIEIEEDFEDFEYPITGKEEDPCGNDPGDLEALATASSQLGAFPCRYETLRFNKGIIKMDGVTALKFVRSRNAKGPQGTDFARSQRQEKVIKAFMDKVFSIEVLANPAKIFGFREIIDDSIKTDIKQNELDDFIKLASKFQNANIQSVIIDVGDSEKNRGGFLTNPLITDEYNLQWVLIPRTGKDNFSEIHEFIKCRLTREECIVSEIQ